MSSTRTTADLQLKAYGLSLILPSGRMRLIPDRFAGFRGPRLGATFGQMLRSAGRLGLLRKFVGFVGHVDFGRCTGGGFREGVGTFTSPLSRFCGALESMVVTRPPGVRGRLRLPQPFALPQVTD